MRRLLRVSVDCRCEMGQVVRRAPHRARLNDEPEHVGKDSPCGVRMLYRSMAIEAAEEDTRSSISLGVLLSAI